MQTYPGNLVLHFICGALSDKQAWAMQVLLQRKEFHQHKINLMSSRAVMDEMTHTNYLF